MTRDAGIRHSESHDPTPQPEPTFAAQLRGLVPLDDATRARLGVPRWRQSPRRYVRSRAGWALALLLHALFFAVTWWEMQPHGTTAPVYVRRSDALQVRLIPPALPAAPPPAQPEAPPPPPPARQRPVREPPSPNAMTVTLPASPATVAPQPRLYDADGRPLLPDREPASAASAPGYVDRGVQGDTGVMQHKSSITYQETRFAKDWDKGTNSVDSALKKAVDKTTVKHTFTVLPGVRIHCAVSLAALAGGCGGDPPPPPSPKSGDTRLNMPPATALAPPSEAPPAGPPLDECIAIYRQGKALPQGCPVDTPARSYEAELKEREVPGK